MAISQKSREEWKAVVDKFCQTVLDRSTQCRSQYLLEHCIKTVKEAMAQFNQGFVALDFIEKLATGEPMVVLKTKVTDTGQSGSAQILHARTANEQLVEKGKLSSESRPVVVAKLRDMYCRLDREFKNEAWSLAHRQYSDLDQAIEPLRSWFRHHR